MRIAKVGGAAIERAPAVDGGLYIFWTTLGALEREQE